jgi:two-component system chemotaxis response regulator CheY
MSSRILIVDDAATVRMYHRKMFADAGWRVEEAANGVEALERTLEPSDDGAFDLYVVDVNMPKLDGLAFVRELRRRAEVPQAPVLMISTEAQPQDVAKARDVGANAYLVKPADPGTLVLTAALLLGDAGAARLAAGGIAGERA